MMTAAAKLWQGWRRRLWPTPTGGVYSIWHCVTTADTADECFDQLRAAVVVERGSGELAVLKGPGNADPDARPNARISQYYDGRIVGRRMAAQLEVSR
jgi:hypothetical protein